jgi:photosystem II stability/assembly factor-like uncharacterized protein
MLFYINTKKYNLKLKPTLFTFLFIIIYQIGHCQNVDLPFIHSKTNATFLEIQQEAKTYFTMHPAKKNRDKNNEDNLYNKYKRWEWYWQNRLMPDGSFPNPTNLWNIYTTLQGKKTRSNVWKNISQTTAISGYDGMGRTTSIAFHPSDSNIFYVAAPKGGLWKTTDGGNTYIPKGDNLPRVACADIAIDPSNPNTLYIALNDRYGWWNYTIGIYKSMDDGATWQATAKTYNYSDGKTINELVIHPTNGNVLFSAQSDALYKTIDGGASWVNVLNKGVSYILPKPGNANIWYAASYDYWNSSQVYMSIDEGNTWTQQSNFSLTQNWITLATTIADTNFLAITCNHSTGNELWTSNNGADTLIYKNNLPVLEVFQISPFDKNIMYVGEMDIYKSTNGGSSWTRITKWYDNQVNDVVHADQRSGGVHPITKKIYWCNDGGVYRYTEPTKKWKDISNGLLITQFYKLDVSQSDSNFMIGGTQDNGGRKRMPNGTWDATNGGDAMQVAIDPKNEQTIYTTYVDGELYRSYDQWDNDTYFGITPDTNDFGSWITPYQIDPNNNNALVAGYTDVYKSIDNGDSWNKLSTNLAGSSNNDNLDALAVSPSNSSVIYTSNGNRLYVTKNSGANWTNKMVPNSNGDFEDITSIAVHPIKESTIWFSKGGYNTNHQLFKSTDYGLTFKNQSYNLPNVPASCILIDQESDSSNLDLYIGLDGGGVFYKKDKDTIWQYYGIGLPNTEVTDLKIQYATHKLVIATYGRGIWETQIVRKQIPLSIPIINQPKVLNVFVANSFQKWIVTLQSNQQQLTKYILYDALGKIVMQEPLQIQNGETTFVIATQNLAKGIYILTLENKFGERKTQKIMLD